MKRIAVETKGTLILIGTSLGLALAGCSSTGAVEVTPVSVTGPALTASDSQKTVALKADELLTITLDAQSSTGYAWHVDSIDGKVLRLAGREQITSPVLGGADKQILRFAGVAKGRTTVSLSYQRPWEKAAGPTAAPGRTYTATVDVMGAYTGNYRDPSASYVPPAVESTSPGVTAVPAAYTYCNTSSCTPIKDQGQCGSCWAFASTGVVEQVQKKQNGTFVPLSEQHLVSCNTSGYSCAGGWQGFPWYYNRADKSGQIGTVYSSDFPYYAADVACVSRTHHDRLTSWAQISSGQSSTATIKQAIYDYGPVWVAVCSDSSFSYYTGGVYYGSNCTSANHAVVLTGWDDSTGTFLLRNSWGSGWGESGYMRIRYGVNALGIATSYVTMSGGCVPDCTGKACGSDGCGGSCGTCPTGYSCDASGQCVSGCVPDCTGKVCGDDGCGGSCGTCPTGQTCNASGQCVSSSCTTYTGSLNGTGDYEYQPNGNWYYSATSGTHSGALTGPSGTNFDLELYKTVGSTWSLVARSASSTSSENVSYNGTAGYYYWRVISASGSGSYSVCVSYP